MHLDVYVDEQNEGVFLLDFKCYVRCCVHFIVCLVAQHKSSVAPLKGNAPPWFVYTFLYLFDLSISFLVGSLYHGSGPTGLFLCSP